MHYRKPALTYDDQMALLKGRGLVMDDEVSARHALERIGYYRLSAYFIPFKVPGQDLFLTGSTFRKVLDLYQFDARLRLIVMQAIDHVEVSVRASLTYKLGHQLGPFGYTDPAHFAPFMPSAGKGIPAKGFDHANFLAKLKREVDVSKEDFVAHYRSKYTSERFLPIWMATELLSLGTISTMAAAVPTSLRKQMARDYGISASHFVSWLRSIAYVRNVCAHHGRLWNRELSLKPELLREWNVNSADAGRMYAMCLVLRHLLQHVSPSFRWTDGLITLMGQYPGVSRIAMRFPADWQNQPPWPSGADPLGG